MVGAEGWTANAARRVIPGGVNSGQRRVAGLEDLVVVRSSGSRIVTSNGRELIDFHSAFGPQILGHNDPDVDRAVAAALDVVDLPGIGVTPPEIELAELLVDAVPSIEKVLLTSTGSEATFHALRVARTATGRSKIIKFQGCYHGWHDSVAMNVISPPDRVGKQDPLSEGILPAVLEATIVLPFNDSAAVRQAFEENPTDIAAIIVEPIPHNIGAVLPEPGFLETLRAVTSEFGAVLIFDEVITGFRHALGGFQSIVDITPDLTTLGKAFANGYPIAALGGRSDMMELFSTTAGRPAFFAGTYNGHPAMAAAAVATIQKLKSAPVYDHIFRLGERARGDLIALHEELGVEAVVSGYGSVFVTYYQAGPVRNYSDLLRNDADLFTGVRMRSIEDGILQIPLNLKRNSISFAHSEQDVADLVASTRSSLERMISERPELATA